jgi:O-antigen ligase
MSFLSARPYLIDEDTLVAAQARSRAVRIFDWLILVWFCALLAFGPLAFGAVQEWAIFALESGAAVCVALWVARELIRNDPQVRFNPLFIPILLFAAVVGTQLLFGRTAYWYVTWKKALLWGSYGLIFFASTQVLRRTLRIRTFALFLTGFGFLVALFAMVQQFTWNGKLYWVVANRNGGWVYGPYVNHAHYAGLMELLVPFPLIFALASFWPKPLRILFAFAAMLMAGTIFLSQSLGGILAFLMQILVLGAITLFHGERFRRQFLVLVLLGIVFAAWLAVLSPGGISERIARLHDPLGKTGAADRLVIVRDSLKMIAARPVLGWGLGTFPVVFPKFRSFYTNYFVNEAHNDYVQTAVETGLVGFATLCGFIVLFYRTSLRNIDHWRADVRQAVCLASIIGVTGILVHSFSDFNLQIPANAALFFALSAVGTGNFESKHPLTRSTGRSA